jgi:cysteine desulfurase/selenocysteine lyase
MISPVETRIDFAKVRKDFPILGVLAHGQPLAYLDNAATSQKPLDVIEAVNDYYRTKNANVHRGVHHLSQLATAGYEGARAKVARLLGAGSEREVVFTRGCTEGINLVASGLTSALSSKKTGHGGAGLGSDDVILVSEMEHHSNIVPWQMSAERVGAEIKPIPVTDSGEIDREAYRRLLASGGVRVVAIAHVSNAMGSINPLKELIAEAHQAGARVLVDGAQAGPHLRIDVQALDADYYTLSCHKIYAPTGVGVLWGKPELLEELPPLLGGGDMIHTVSLSKGSTYAPVPAKFEAGTPNIAGVIGLGAAVDYLESLTGSLDRSFEEIHAREAVLLERATAGLEAIRGVKLYGTAKPKSAIVSFTVEGVHPHDIGTILDSEGIAIRAGHHCCMPLMERYGIPATARASFAFYNTEEEVDRLLSGVRKVQEMFAA